MKPATLLALGFSLSISAWAESPAPAKPANVTIVANVLEGRGYCGPWFSDKSV